MVTNNSNASRNVPATSRRRFLFAAAAMPLAAVAEPRDSKEAIDMNMYSPGAFNTDISVWNALVSDYRAKRAAWQENCDWDDTLPELEAARASLPPEPIKPKYTSRDISHLTLAQIRDAPEDPEYAAAMEVYTVEKAAWDTHCAAVLDPIRKPAEAHGAEIWKAYMDALNLVAAYSAASISELREKLEIIADEYRDCEFPNDLVDLAIIDARRLEAVG